MKTLIAALIILGLTGCVSTQGVETARGMDSAKVSGGHGLGECPKGTVEVQFLSFEEMNRLQDTVCQMQAAFGKSRSRGCSGPVAGLYTGGTVYATDLDSAIHEIGHHCGWRHDA